LQQSINNNIEVLYSLQAFYNASTEVSKQDFKQFVGPTLSRHSAIHSLNWIVRVPAAQKAAYEAAIRAEGFPAFQIYERTPDKKQVKAKVRSEYFPIAYREALEEDPK
jgi:CHASE domain.